ncbi:hypothetical protein P7K49_023259 [Saguinus oedipus]|uniref:Uncharacterized protein n=1 Tax=Saguinus oedipus TaxID=9490 RepID=A0ABQ9UMP7_SAGOE|nr:hypothetical protein P7K49_023259 [Saguinus oedipus]
MAALLAGRRPRGGVWSGFGVRPLPNAPLTPPVLCSSWSGSGFPALGAPPASAASRPPPGPLPASPLGRLDFGPPPPQGAAQDPLLTPSLSLTPEAWAPARFREGSPQAREMDPPDHFGSSCLLRN